MTTPDSRTPRHDPREPLWLSVVTFLFVLAEGALVTLVLLGFRGELFTLTTWLATRSAALTTAFVEATNLGVVADLLRPVSLLVPVGWQQVWLVVLITAVVFGLLGMLINVRQATRALLEATYLTSGSFRRRKADTLARLEHMLQ